MRLAPASVVLVTACGIDVSTMPPDPERPDAGVTANSSDAAPIPPDAIPPNLTPCEQAVYHSDLSWIQEQVFDVSCTTMCHSGTSPGADMNLTPGQAHANLVNVSSTTHSGWTRVVPGNAGASMLMVQIGGEPGPELEGLMPWNQPKLCNEKIDAIRRWIAAGAQP